MGGSAFKVQYFLKIKINTTKRFSPGDDCQLTWFQDIRQTEEVMFSHEYRKLTILKKL